MDGSRAASSMIAQKISGQLARPGCIDEEKAAIAFRQVHWLKHRETVPFENPGGRDRN
jgi:hypothetical protein